MADTYIQVPPDSSGKKVETQEVTEAGGTVVERQVIALGDVAAALYQVLQALQRPVSVEYNTGRSRVSLEVISAGVTLPTVTNLVTFGNVIPRDLMTWQLERQAWLLNVGVRIV